MAIVVKDRVKENFTTTGTADFTLGGAVVGFQAFSAIGNTNYTYYAAVDPATGAWEVGYGQYLSAGPTLTRNTILSSSAAGAKVSFGSGSKDVFCTYPSEKAIYEEAAGNVIFAGGPITVVGTGVTSYTSFSNFFAEMFGNANTFVQQYLQNQNSGSDASADYVALNDVGSDTEYYVDMGINSSGYSSGTYQIYTPNSGYLYSVGGANPSKMFVGSGDDDLILHAGGFATTNIAVTISGADQSVTVEKDAFVNGTLDVTGAATFGNTVLLNANPSLALQAATKAYVDEQVTAGIHIHAPVLVETTGNLTAAYTQGGTTFNITTITGTNTVTTSVNHGLSVNDQIWLYSTAGNGLSTNTAYFVYSTPALNQLTLSLNYGGAQLTGLTNATGLVYATRANSGVGAKLTNSGAQTSLAVDGITSATTPPLVVGSRVMVRLQTATEQNGVYTVTNMGSISTNWELTRATDANFFSPQDTNGLGEGDYFYTQYGTLNAGDSHVLTTPGNIIIGYTGLTYTQFSGAVTYTGGTNIDVTGQVISLTGTVAATNGGTGTNTVTTGDLLYGSATNTWSNLAKGGAYRALVMDASGTNVEWNAVALNQSNAVSGTLPVGYGGTGITGYAQGEMLYANTTTTLDKVTANTTTTKKFLSQTGTGTAGQAPSWAQPAASDITGLAPSATTDTTNADNITSGTLGTSRLSGSYTGITGVGTLTAGTWNAGTIAAGYGGTGLTSYAVGDLVYADTTTSLAKLADVATGNALISGGVGSAPSWGKIGLATHVSGTLPIANGGTGTTSTTFVNLTTNVTGTLPVGNGGTGAATFTANNVLLGNGTSAFQVVAPGTAGNLLTSNGTTWTSSPAPSGMVYPGAGIPNSTGTSWGTSYSTTGSGTVVALATSPSFTTPVLGTPTSGDFSTGTFTWPTFNQNTTGSAATLTTPRAIYGNNFDGSAALTQVIASTYGGTGNGFTKFSGPTSSEKTFTLPDATATILTTNAAVTVGQGGTGQTSYTDGQLLIGNSVGNTLTKAILSAGSGISITNGNGSISISASGSGTVTSVSWTGGIVSVANPTTTPAFTIAGTSGGIPYFSSASTWASSAALAANALVIGGGAGAAPATTTTGTGVLTALASAVNTSGGLATTSRVVVIADGTSITMNVDTTDMATQANTQAVGTLTINAPTGTPYNGQKIMLRLLSTNIQTFSWNAIFAGSTDLGLPTVSTGSSKYDYMGFIYNSTAIKWQMISKNFGF
jgi:hypothetical protein